MIFPLGLKAFSKMQLWQQIHQISKSIFKSNFSYIFIIKYVWVRPYSHKTFWRTILRLHDIFEPWISKGQGKLLTKKIKVHKQTKQFKVRFLELTLVCHWNIKIIFLSCVIKASSNYSWPKNGFANFFRKCNIVFKGQNLKKSSKPKMWKFLFVNL